MGWGDKYSYDNIGPATEAPRDLPEIVERIKHAQPHEVISFAESMEDLFAKLGDARALLSKPCSFAKDHTWADMLAAVRAGVRLGGGPNDRTILPAFDVVPCHPNGHALALRGVAAGKLMVGHWRVTIAGNDYTANTNEAMAVAAILAGHTEVSALGFIVMDPIPTPAAATFVLENVKPHDRQDPNDLQVDDKGQIEYRTDGQAIRNNLHGLLFGADGS